MEKRIRFFFKDNHGATIIEYSVIALIITFALFSTLSFVGTTGKDVLISISSVMDDAHKKSTQSSEKSSDNNQSQQSQKSEKIFIY